MTPRLVAAASLLVFMLLAVVHTWPLATDPAHLSRVDPGDGALNTWAVAWVGHALVHHPSTLFDANIFYPERYTLAFSEAMLVQGAMAAPVIALGGSAVLAYNLVLLTGFALTGWLFCLLLYRWTGSWSAGFVTGSMAAFNAHVLVRLTHLQTQHPEFIAVILFALDRTLSNKRIRDAVLLGAAVAMQGFASIYLLAFSAWLVLFATAARAGDWIRSGAVAIARTIVGGMAGLLLLAPYLLVYWRVHSSEGFARGVSDESPASLADYLSTGATVHAWWSKAFWPDAAAFAFPGVVGLAFVVAALAIRETRKDPRVRMSGLAALGCAAVSFAPRLPFYSWLHRVVPMFQVVRVQAHLSQVVLILLGIVAGFGVWGLERRWRNRRSWAIVAVISVLLVNVEALRAPVGWSRFDGVPAVYQTLADDPTAVLVELPFPLPQQWFMNTPYMVNSTRHWKPMLNGYSGFRPPSYERSSEAVEYFPEDQSLIALHALGVTYVVVHRSAYVGGLGQARFDAVLRTRSLQRVADDGEVFIFRLQEP